MPDGGLLFDEGIKCVDILDEPIKWNLPFENILIGLMGGLIGLLFNISANFFSDLERNPSFSLLICERDFL